MTRDDVPKELVDGVMAEFNKFLNKKIEEKGPGAFVSAHEAYGAIMEEVNEVGHAIHNNWEEATESELMDVAVSCLWGVMSLRRSKTKV